MEENTWTEYKNKVKKEDPGLIKRMERNTKYSLRIEKSISFRDCKGDNEDIPSILQDFEDEIRQENVQLNKETAEKYSLGVVKFIKDLFNMGQIDFKAKIELLKENEKLAKSLGVEIKE